jgi:hypothetical protein
MFDKWLKLPAHYWLRVTALVILVIGVAVSNVLMSIGAIWIISNWLIEAKFSDYGQRLKRSPELILILLFLGYSILTIAWSDDFWYAFHDIRIKLPVLAIPLALGSGAPLDRKIFHFLLFLFIGIVAFTSALNFIWFNFYSLQADIRQMSWFISQIRFATLVDLALFSTLFLILEKKLKWFVGLVLIIWFALYTFYAQVLNGYILFALLFLFTIAFLVIRVKSKNIKLAILSFFILVFVSGLYYLNGVFKNYKGPEQVEFRSLELYTVNGNPYYHDTLSTQVENGQFVWLYVAVDEIEKEWNKRSVINYDSLDQKGQPIYGTVLRYLTSKHERKDSAGIWSLSDEEIKKVESGCTSVEMNKGLESKLHSFLFEYEMYQGGADPNGFSLLQRLEHLKTARAILADHWVFGVGIGDVDSVFQTYYEKANTKLLPENRLRSHNQFISAWIALGIVGLIITVLLFVVPVFQKTKRDYFLGITLIALAVAFGFEDMLETQAGATIFALFYSLAVFREARKV